MSTPVQTALGPAQLLPQFPEGTLRGVWCACVKRERETDIVCLVFCLPILPHAVLSAEAGSYFLFCLLLPPITLLSPAFIILTLQNNRLRGQKKNSLELQEEPGVLGKHGPNKKKTEPPRIGIQ